MKNLTLNFSNSLLYALIVFAIAEAVPVTSLAQAMSFPTREESVKLPARQLDVSALPADIYIANNLRGAMLGTGNTFFNYVKYKSNITFVKLAIDHDTDFIEQSAYVYKIMFELRGSTNKNDSTVNDFTVSDSLVIGYNPDSLAAFQDMQVKMYPNLFNARLRISGVYDMTTGAPVQVTVPASMKQNFFIELGMQYQPFLKTHSDPASMLLTTTKSYDPSRQLLDISWTPYYSPYIGVVTPVQYQLEWTYADNYGPGGTPLSSSDVHYDFKNNATRVQLTDSPHFSIPVVYPKGYIVYRVRMVRTDSVLYKYPIYGVWSLSAQSGAISSLSSAAYHEIDTAHMGDKVNWNYTIHFAEEGKYKHVLGYFDGMLKNRQTITRFNTNPDELLVTENIYDYEGRPAITTLPSVVDSMHFHYLSDVSICKTTNNPYTAADFDQKPTICPDELPIPSFTNGSLANRYYSTLNIDTLGMQKFVPQAEGYPFVHTQLSPGFEDRVDRQGGAGKDLQIARGHDTRNDYIGADQPELNRLFGVNAGFKDFYNKTVTTDPNGQSSMVIKDYRGKQMATTLVGAAVDTSTIAIMYNEEVPNNDSVREDKLANNAFQFVLQNEKVYNGNFYTDEDANVDIRYEYTFAPFTVCPSPYIGLTVNGNYEYTVWDKCGFVKLHGKDILGHTGITTSSTPVTNASDSNGSLLKGPYTINKSLMIATDDIYAAVDSFLAYHPSCARTEPDFIRQEVQAAPFPCPKADNPCDVLKKKMMEELFPGAKYGRDTIIGGNIAGIAPSIFDIIPNKGFRYRAPCDSVALNQLSITVFSHIYTNLAKLPVDTFLWVYKYAGPQRYDIANVLLPLHPEYCMLSRCYVDTFETRLNAIPDAATAEKYNLFSLNQLVAYDTQLRAKMIASPINMTHIADSLRTMYGGARGLDTMASENAFCLNDNALSYGDALQIFHTQITTFSFPDMAVKNLYFKQLRTLYLGNRRRYVSITQTAGGYHCSPCDSPERMSLTPPPLVVVAYNPNGTFNMSPSGLLGIFGGTLQSNLAALLNSGSSMITDTAIIHAYRDSAVAYLRSTDSSLNIIAVDSIVSRLSNCYSGSVQQTRLKDSLMAMVLRGEVHNGAFVPEQIRAAITGAGLSLTGLCHPYLCNYDYYSADNSLRGNCEQQSFYDDVAGFLNSGFMKTALPVTGSSPAITVISSWPSGNFAGQVSAGIHSGSGSVNLVSWYEASSRLYRLAFFKTGSTDSVIISLQSPRDVIVSGTTYAFFQNCTDLAFNSVNCYFEDPLTSAEGHIGRYMFRTNVTRYDGSSATTSLMPGWNNGVIALNNADRQNPIEACVPCTQFKALYAPFKDTMTSYGGYAADHPLFYKSLRNFMNYSLKKVFDETQYNNFLQSCALADNDLIPMYGGFGRTYFPGSFYSNFTLFSNAVYASYGFRPKATVQSVTTPGSAEEDIISYASIPYSKIRFFDSIMVATANGVVATAATTNVGRLWLPVYYSNAFGLATAGTSLDSVTGSQGVNVKLGFLSLPYRLYEIRTAVALSPQDMSIKIAKLKQNLLDNQIQGYWMPTHLSTVNSDYFKTEKQALLAYTYAMDGLTTPKVLDSLQDYYLKSNISAFSGSDVSYRNPTNPDKYTDLYFTTSANHYPGYDTLQTIINAVKTALGSNHLFIASTGNVYPTSPANPDLKLYRCGDGLYWYRYFGYQSKLYNVYIRVPAYVYESTHSGYQLLSMMPSTGDSATRRFTAVMKNSNDTIYVSGSTDFDIAWSNKLSDVLLGNEDNYGNGTPLSGEVGAPNNCEQQLLYNAIYSGRLKYQNYIDSMRIALRGAFYTHVMSQIGEKLWINYIDKKFATTLYNYDRAGNLIITVPPMGVHKLDSTLVDSVNVHRQNNVATAEVLPVHTKVTRYEYNTANKPIRERTPDGGLKVMYYDAKGNIILSQNDKQRPKGAFTYMLYDGQNRIVETGEVHWGGGCAPFADTVLYSLVGGVWTKTAKPSDCACENIADNVWQYCAPDMSAQYDNAHFDSIIRSHGRTDVVATIYDSAFIDLGLKSGMSAQQNLRNRIAANLYYDYVSPGLPPTAGYIHGTHYSYDIAGNVKTAVQDFPILDGMKQRYKRIDYDYDLLSGKVNMISYNRGFGDQLYQRYSYDADNRITEAQTSHDGFIWNRDAGYTYYKHGPLARVSLGDQRVQGIDYAYTLQGWLKAINGDRIDTAADMGGDGTITELTPKDAYATEIDYFSNDYKPIGQTPITTLSASTKGLYNGNIARQTNDVARFGALTTNYTYDQMNRIRYADYGMVVSRILTFNTWYASSYKYDLDGNIKKLTRRDSSGTLMDSLVYRYPNAGNNKLADVLDYSTFNTAGVEDLKHYVDTSTSRLLYDETGNVVKDLTSGTDSVKWNIYGKVTDIIDTAKKLNMHFTYDGTGQRVSKSQISYNDSGSFEQATYYSRDASGNILAEYNTEGRYSLEYRIKAVHDLHEILLPLTNGQQIWISALQQMGYLNRTAFADGAIAAGGTINYPAGHYLANDASLYQQFLGINGDEGGLGGIGGVFADTTGVDSSLLMLKALSDYSVLQNSYPLALSLKLQIEHDGEDPTTLGKIYDCLFSNENADTRSHALLQVAGSMPGLTNLIMEENHLTLATSDDSALLAEYIKALDSRYVTDWLNDIGHDNKALLSPWLEQLSTDTLYLTDSYCQERGFKTMLLNSLLNYGSDAATAVADSGQDKSLYGIYRFATWWPQAMPIIMKTYAESDLLAIDYADDPTGYLSTLATNGDPLTFTDTALDAQPDFDYPGFSDFLHNASVTKATEFEPLPYDNVLKSQKIWLANHHLYGSSRIGITNYWSDQYSSFWNYTNQSVDTFRLAARPPWYSSGYNGLINTSFTTPYGHGNTDNAFAQHLIGQKQFELTNHLGNVQATVSDLRVQRDVNADGLRDVIHTGIVAAYDYYPFGQLMPKRFTMDTVSHSAYVMQTVLVPQSVNTSLDVHTFSSQYADSLSSGPGPRILYGQTGIMYKTMTVIPNEIINVSVTLGYTASVYTTLPLVRIRVMDGTGTGMTQLGSANAPNPFMPIPLPNLQPQTNTITIQILTNYSMPAHMQLFSVSNVTVTHMGLGPQNTLVQVGSNKNDKYEFGFNGQMKDNEVAGVGNSLDFGARMYNSRLGRWTSLDPLKNNYPAISPYVFVANSPMSLVDKNGKDYKIYYTDFNKDGSKIEASYIYGSKQPVPNVRFVTETIAALADLDKSISIQPQFDYFKGPQHSLAIHSGTSTYATGISEKIGSGASQKTTSVVKFNPTEGLRGKTDGKIMTPAEALWHEIGHDYDEVKSPVDYKNRNKNVYAPGTADEHWTDEEEKYDILNNEQPLMKERGDLIRNEHDGSDTEIIKMQSSTSHEEDNMPDLPLAH